MHGGGGSGSVTGGICEAVASAMVVKNELNALAILVGSEMIV